MARFDPPGTFPRKLRGRIALLNRLANAPGPLALRQDEVILCFARLKQFRQIRRLAAHAVFEVRNGRVVYQSYSAGEGGALVQSGAIVDIRQLRLAANEIEAYGQAVARMLSG